MAGTRLGSKLRAVARLAVYVPWTVVLMPVQALADVEVDEAWGAYVDSTPDAVPVISPVEQIRGFYLAAGCSGHGFGVGPGIGFVAAELIVNEAPSIDLSPFRLSRLSDGSRIEVGAL